MSVAGPCDDISAEEKIHNFYRVYKYSIGILKFLSGENDLVGYKIFTQVNKKINCILYVFYEDTLAFKILLKHSRHKKLIVQTLAISFTLFCAEDQFARVCSVTSVMSDSLQPHGPWPTRLLCPWDSPGKNTGVGCHFLLQH